MSARDLVDDTLRASGRGTVAELEAARWLDCAQHPDRAHFRDGFGWPDGRFRFRPDWAGAASAMPGGGDASAMPCFPDHWAVIEEASAAHPFRLTTSPARNFLNSSFTETRTGRAKEERPSVMIHPEDAAPLGIAEGTAVELSNRRGAVRLHAKLFDGLRRGVLVAESIWPNDAHADGRGINTLTGMPWLVPGTHGVGRRRIEKTRVSGAPWISGTSPTMTRKGHHPFLGDVRGERHCAITSPRRRSASRLRARAPGSA